MNFEFINPFIESTINVLKTMAQTDATPGQPAIKTGQAAGGDVTGIAGMIGEKAHVSFAITFSNPVILVITGNMLGEDIDESAVDETVADSVGEITNMVTGGSKRILAEKGFKFDLVRPSIITGANHMINHQLKAPTVMLPFTSNAGDFFIEICSLYIDAS